MTVKDIFEFLNKHFPTDTACDFDNVGILVGDENATVTKTLIALDCTSDVIEQAVKNGCNLIITHHPVIFHPLKNVLKGSIVHKLIENGLSVICMHTNLDIAQNGVTDVLCDSLSPKTKEFVTAEDGYTLIKCEISPVSSEVLANKLKNSLGGTVKYAPTERPIKTVLFCSGSGGNFVEDAHSLNCDALITADVKHSHFLWALENSIALFDAGHFNTEDVIVEPLKEMLSREFKGEFLTTHISKIKSC